MSVDVQSLTQKVEFLEFQLEDYQRREAQHKAMYESLLASLAAPSDASPLKCQCSFDRERYEREAEDLRRQLAEAQQTTRDLDFCVRDQKLSHEQALLEASRRMVQLESENKELSWQAQQHATESRSAKLRSLRNLRPHLGKLKSDLAALRSLWTTDGECARQLLQESLLCARDIYEERLQRNKEQLAALRTQVQENNDAETVAQLRDQLRDKSAEVEQLKHVLWQKFSEQRYSCRDCLQLLEGKEKQVEELKRQAGELRIQLGSPQSLKPPSPSHCRAVSHSPRDDTRGQCDDLRRLSAYQRMLDSCSHMQCEQCAGLFVPSEFHDHLLECRLDTLDTSRGRKTEDDAKTQALKDQVSLLESERSRALSSARQLESLLRQAKRDQIKTDRRLTEQLENLKTGMRMIESVLYRARDSVGRNKDLDDALLSLRELSRPRFSQKALIRSEV